MEAININRLSKLYHLRPSQKDWQRLLDATLWDVMNEHLEPAVDALGINTYEEVCVRLVHVPLSFNFGKSQYDTSLHWSKIIARHIRATLDNSSTNMIRYETRFHALMSFADDVSRHDLRYLWAWKQLGLVNLQDDAGLAQVREQLAQALTREPGASYAAFLRLAQQHRLEQLLGEFSRTAVELLFDNILRESGVDRQWLDTTATGFPADLAQQVAPAQVSAAMVAESMIFEHLIQYPSQVANASSPLTLRAWSILVVLELEPMLFHRPTALIVGYITAVESFLISATNATQWRGADHVQPVYDSKKADIEPGEPGAADDFAAFRATLKKQQRAAQESATKNSIPQPGPIEPVNSDPVETWRGEFSQVQNDLAADAVSRAQLTVASEEEDRAGAFFAARPDPDSTAINTPEKIDTAENRFLVKTEILTSEFGGLFYLLGVLGNIPTDCEDNLVTRLATETTFNGRALSWLLYQLVTRWFKVETDDPGLRLFCGIDTQRDWPWPSDDRASVSESRLLDKYAQEIESRVFQKLQHAELTAGALMAFVCRRQVRIKIDSGWVELLFYLADVDTDIRRAGMDLDPGYVAWLGKVVKIRYE